jgi:hypothetical protein
MRYQGLRVGSVGEITNQSFFWQSGLAPAINKNR